MTCQQSLEIDLAEFLADPNAESLRGFQAHYPTCADCAEAVAGWLALDQAIQDVAAESMTIPDLHPTPDELEAFVARSDSMGDRTMQIQQHLDHCNGCATEVRLMQRFDAAALVEATMPEKIRSTSALSERPSPFDLIGWLGVLRDALAGSSRGWAWAPAAVAVAIALAIWLSLAGGGGLAPSTEPKVPALAERPGQQMPAGGSPAPRAEGPTPAPERLARDAGEAASTQRLAREDEATQPGTEPPTEGSSPDLLDTAGADATESMLADAGDAAEPPPAADATREREEEVVLLAALDDLPPLEYARPADRTAQGWMRQFGPIRSGGARALVETRAPVDHAGLTLDETPRLWWALTEATEAPIELTVVDEEALDPLLRIVLPGRHEPGLHSIDLSAHGVELQPDVQYRWFVTVLLDPDRPSRNPVAVGTIEVVDQASPLREQAGPEDDVTRGHRLASLGLWYDAFDFYATMAERYPSIERLALERDRLSRLAGDRAATTP